MADAAVRARVCRIAHVAVHQGTFRASRVPVRLSWWRSGPRIRRLTSRRRSAEVFRDVSLRICHGLLQRQAFLPDPGARLLRARLSRPRAGCQVAETSALGPPEASGGRHSTDRRRLRASTARLPFFFLYVQTMDGLTGADAPEPWRRKHLHWLESAPAGPGGDGGGVLEPDRETLAGAGLRPRGRSSGSSSPRISLEEVRELSSRLSRLPCPALQRGGVQDNASAAASSREGRQKDSYPTDTMKPSRTRTTCSARYALGELGLVDKHAGGVHRQQIRN